MVVLCMVQIFLSLTSLCNMGLICVELKHVKINGISNCPHYN